jgi:hypothetical protein
MMRLRALAACLVAALAGGCASPYHADRGALFGGATGAGVGALVGEAVGHPAAGALIGAGVGTVSGAAVGSELDGIEARNQAMIASQLGQPPAPGAVSINEVIAMTQNGVGENLIVNLIRSNGVERPPQSGDLITLERAKVSPRVIEAMQTSAVPMAAPVVVPGPPVMVAPPPPYWGPYPGPYPYYYGPYPYPPRPRYGYGFGFSVGR